MKRKIGQLMLWTRRKAYQIGVVLGLKDKVDHSFYMHHALARMVGFDKAFVVFESSLEIRKTEGDPKTVRQNTNATVALVNVTPLGRG